MDNSIGMTVKPLSYSSLKYYEFLLYSHAYLKYPLPNLYSMHAGHFTKVESLYNVHWQF